MLSLRVPLLSTTQLFVDPKRSLRAKRVTATRALFQAGSCVSDRLCGDQVRRDDLVLGEPAAEKVGELERLGGQVLMSQPLTFELAHQLWSVPDNHPQCEHDRGAVRP